MKTPMKNPAAVALGRLGGKAGTGKSKARKVTSEQARKAVMARWAKRKKQRIKCRESPFERSTPPPSHQ